VSAKVFSKRHGGCHSTKRDVIYLLGFITTAFLDAPAGSTPEQLLHGSEQS